MSCSAKTPADETIGPGSRARATGERSRQTGFVHCEPHHWWFGYAHFAADPAGHPMVGKLGPNALDLSLEEFRSLLRGRRGAIKAFLLDQDRTAGMGQRLCPDAIVAGQDPDTDHGELYVPGMPGKKPPKQLD